VIRTRILLMMAPGLLAAQSPVIPTRHQVSGNVELRHERRALDRAPQWSLDGTPIHAAGGADDPEHDLTNARYVELLSDGSVVTLAPVGSRLIWFPANAGKGRSLSRQGNGPGELMAPGGMARAAGDTIVIHDGANNRVNWIVPGKGFVANVAWPNPSVRPTQFAGALRSGQLVFSTSGRVQSASKDSISRPPAQVIVVSPRATSLRVVADVPDLDLVSMETRYRGRSNRQAMVRRFTRLARVVAWDTVIATSGSDGYRIELLSGAGKRHTSIVVARPRRAVTQAMRDSVVAADLRRLSAPGSEGLVDPNESRRLARATPSADSLPAHGRFFVAPNRMLWVVDYQAPGDVRGSATAFRQDGAIMARLTWNGSGTPEAFGIDRVVMRELDADGVITLKVYRIRREPSVGR
jgi:hypothetical protein